MHVPQRSRNSSSTTQTSFSAWHDERFSNAKSGGGKERHFRINSPALRRILHSRCVSARVLSGPLRQPGTVRLNLPNRFNDVIHVAAVSQKQILGQTDGRRADLTVAFEFMETLSPGLQPIGAEKTLESARVD